MHLPGLPSLAFLAYLLLVLPWVAFRSTRRLRAAPEASAPPARPSRAAIWISSLVSQGLLFGLAWMAARNFGYAFTALPERPGRALLAGVVALAVCLGIWALGRLLGPPKVRRTALVYTPTRRSAREQGLRLLVMLAASIAEEVAYRGVGWALLTYMLGNAWLAAGVSAAAFALTDWVQGGRRVLASFALALVLHALVAFTGTLAVAIAVHLAFDLIAGALLSREAHADAAREAA